MLSNMPKTLEKYAQDIDPEDIILYKKLLVKRIKRYPQIDMSDLLTVSAETFEKSFLEVEVDYSKNFKEFVQDYIWILNEFKTVYERRDFDTMAELCLLSEAMLPDLYESVQHRFDK